MPKRVNRSASRIPRTQIPRRQFPWTQIPATQWLLLFVVGLLTLSSAAQADVHGTVASLEETVRILESGKVKNVADFCPHLRREQEKARQELVAERAALQHAKENPPRTRDNRVQEGWARNLKRRQSLINGTAVKLAKLEKRISRLCPPEVGNASVDAASELAGATILVTPTAFAGGRLQGVVLNEQGRPLPFTSLAVEASQRADDLIETDASGRFELELSAAPGEVSFTLPGADTTAASRIVDARRSSLPSFNNALGIQPGTRIELPERVEDAWIEQSSERFEAPSALASSSDGDRFVSSVLVPSALSPGAARLTLRDHGVERALDLTLYRIESSFLDQDQLRSGQRAAFGWTIDVGPSASGAPVTICARDQGPIDVTGQRCSATHADQEGRVHYASSIRAQSVKGEVPFRIEAEIQFQPVEDDAQANAGEPTRAQREKAEEAARERERGERHRDSTEGHEAYQEAGKIELELAKEHDEAATDLIKDRPSIAAKHRQHAARHYEQARDDFRKANKTSRSNEMKNLAQRRLVLAGEAEARQAKLLEEEAKEAAKRRDADPTEDPSAEAEPTAAELWERAANHYTRAAQRFREARKPTAELEAKARAQKASERATEAQTEE